MVLFVCFSCALVSSISVMQAGGFPWKEPVLEFFLTRQTTEASHEDLTHAKKVTGLEVIDTYHSTTEAVMHGSSLFIFTKSYYECYCIHVCIFNVIIWEIKNNVHNVFKMKMH